MKVCSKVNRRFVALLLALAVLVGGIESARAQQTERAPVVVSKVRDQTTAANNIQNAPFKIGETLIYEASFSKLLLRGVDVADLKFEVVADKTAANKITIKAQANSKGGLLKIASFFAPGDISFLQKFDSTVQTDDFRILQTLRYDEQNKRVRNSEANFDYATRKVVYREIDPNDAMRPARLISSILDSPTQDLVSVFYYLRSQRLAVGQNYTIRLSDGGIVYEVPVKIAAREQINSAIGKFWTLRVEPQIFGAHRPLAGEGTMKLWFTDDARHLPLRSQVEMKSGKLTGRFEVKIKQAQNLQPLK